MGGGVWSPFLYLKIDRSLSLSIIFTVLPDKNFVCNHNIKKYNFVCLKLIIGRENQSCWICLKFFICIMVRPGEKDSSFTA